MENKGIGRGKRILLHLLQHGMAVIAAVCIALIVCYTYYEFILPSGDRYSTMMYPWESEGVFEDTYLFEHYFRNSISSTIRMSVIKSQLETDGVYDGSKKIDIYSFVNRRSDLDLPQDVGAQYYLEDLIKWNEYGFEFQEIQGPTDEMGHYFEAGADADYRIEEKPETEAASTAATKSAQSAIKEVENLTEETVNEEAIASSAVAGTGTNTETAYLPSEVVSEYVVESGLDKITVTVDEERPFETVKCYEVLKERYQAVDGRNIMDFVSDWDSYYEFCEVLQEASRQISLNYAEYKYMNDNFSADQTNLRYCIQIPGKQSGKYEFFTNEKIGEIGPDITAYFRNYGKYFYYYPEHLEYETNTDFPEEYIRNILNQYEYVYPENTKIWIAMDTTYPVKDFLWDNKARHDSFMPYYILCLGILAASVLCYFVLWVYLTLKEGKPCKIAQEGEKSKIILYQFDRIPSELVLLLAPAAAYATAWGIYLIGYLVESSGPQLSARLLIASSVGLALFASCSFMLVYYSIVRRLKAHVFWKHTLLAKLVKWLGKWFAKAFGWMKKIALAVYNDSNILVRVILPYVLFLLANAVLCSLGFYMLDYSYPTIACMLPFILLILLDAAVAVMQFRENRTRKQIVEGIEEITKGNLHYQIETQKMYGDNLILAQAVNSIGEGIRSAVETSMKDERLKADLITNVSHDIKTPLTSIINYVDLIKRENIQDEKIKGYIEVLDSKSQRLKQLTEDLVEASKISSGNIEYHLECINFVELIHQTLGEFSEKFEEKNLAVMAKFPEEAMPILADSRRIWRVIENLYNNIYKYAMPGTRVYMDMTKRQEEEKSYVCFAVKNISAQPLNINADELTERFIRGDVSRSTEGSGLGLSIAKNLTQAQNGSFTIYLDGDLFKVILEFPLEASRT